MREIVKKTAECCHFCPEAAVASHQGWQRSGVFGIGFVHTFPSTNIFSRDAALTRRKLQEAEALLILTVFVPESTFEVHRFRDDELRGRFRCAFS
jgi:hypothetical protein